MDMEEMKFTREERAGISKNFRNEIKAHGLFNAVLTVLDSQSEKNEVKKAVLAQQCRKKSFANSFEAVCQALQELYPRRKFELRAFKEEILPQ